MVLISEKEYRARVDKLASTKNFSYADDAFFKELDALTLELKNMITYNTDDLRSDGVTYYVSNSGDDNNDGMSPDKAFATLDKISTIKLNEGDLVLFERGGLWRGNMVAQSGVSYSAYGSGPKPKIYKAFDGMDGEWVETEYKNVWKFNKPLEVADIGTVVFNDGDCYADKKYEFDELCENYQFRFLGTDYKELQENFVYLYCDKGNPKKVFEAIDLSFRVAGNSSVVRMPHRSHDIHLKNLDLRYGMDTFFPSRSKNISISYCICGWQGGHTVGAGKLRFGGGSGAWHSCDGMHYDHCHIYQQFDAGVDPQYQFSMETSGVPAVLNDYVVTDCLFEHCEYTFEYFNTQYAAPGNKLSNFYTAYNICRYGGRGFGDKHTGSAYIKMWQAHENFTENFVFEKNIFDRAASRVLILGARESYVGAFSVKQLPKLIGNLYIDRYNKPFAVVNYRDYRYNQDSLELFKEMGISKDETYIYTK